jgi:hypothetical protein
LETLPATPDTVARFLSAQATAGVKASTIGRRAAAIGYAHKLAGHREPPSNAEAVKAIMRRIRRTIGTAPERKAPATADVILQMQRHCPGTLAGKRDRALLARGFANERLPRTGLAVLGDRHQCPGCRIRRHVLGSQPAHAAAGSHYRRGASGQDCRRIDQDFRALQLNGILRAHQHRFAQLFGPPPLAIVMIIAHALALVFPPLFLTGSVHAAVWGIELALLRDRTCHVRTDF